MKQIPNIGLMRLNNGEHHQFHLSVYNLLFDCQLFLIIPSRSEMVRQYYEDYETQGKAMNRERGSLKTQEMIKANRTRDEYESSFRLKVKSAMLDSNPDIREAATRLKFIIDKYGDIKKLSYSEKNGVFDVRFNELLDNYVTDIQKIDAQNILNQLNGANQGFNLTFGARSIEKISAAKQNVLNTRATLDADYREIVLQLNSLAVVEPSLVYDQLIEKISYQIAYFRQQVANRYARLAADKTATPPAVV